MVSFESLFGKKSNLHKIWLAAHYEKKLSKNQMVDIDIRSIIDEIIKSKEKISIRISGHLLFGVCRIYHKKTIYILAKVNESFTKKISEEKTINLEDKENHRITLDLPDVKKFQDYIDKMGDKLQTVDLKMLQSRREDITLPNEKMPSLSLMMNPTQEDVNIPQFEDEVMRSFIGGMETSAYNISHLSNTLLEQPDFVPDDIPAKVEIADNHVSNLNKLEEASALELPAERTMFSEIPSKSRIEDSTVNKRKRKRVVDHETLISTETMKSYLNDPSCLIKDSSYFEKMDHIERPLKILAIGTVSSRFGILFDDLKIPSHDSAFDILGDEKIEEIEHPLPVELGDFDAGLYEPVNATVQDKIESTIQNITFSHEINQTLDELTTFLISNEHTDFKSFTLSDDRKSICRKFVSLLHLHKYEFVHLEQAQPYGSISIIGGSRSMANITAL